jgi:hypothetical protein
MSVSSESSSGSLLLCFALSFQVESRIVLRVEIGVAFGAT